MSQVSSERICFSLGLATPILLVAFAVALTTLQHIAACPLCIVQRLLYLAIAGSSLFGLLGRSHVPLRRFSALLITLFGATGATVASYQVYLQRNPFTATCGDGSAWWERLVNLLGSMVPMLFKADGLCSDESWSLLGLSMPEWSFLAFGGMFILGLTALFTQREK